MFEGMTHGETKALPAARGDWKAELARVWAGMPNKGFFLGLLAAWVLVFQFLGNATFGHIDSPSLFVWLYGVYTAPHHNDDHGLLIPFVVAGLFWWKREELAAVRKELWRPGLLMLAAAMLLHVVGSLIQQARLSALAFFLGVYGLMGLAWGPAWLRASFFPFFLFGFCIPVGSLAEHITFPMRLVVTNATVVLAQALDIDVAQDGSRIFNAARTFQYDVAPACSGVRSLMALVVLGTVYGWITFKSWWRRGVMIAVALPLAVVGNVARVTAVVITAQVAGHRAGERLHDYAGFVTFAVAIGCVIWLSRLLREHPPENVGGERSAKTAPSSIVPP